MWKNASVNVKCVVVGDMNLDFKTWETPEQGHKNMVEKTKAEIEMSGFTQLVKDVTRCWKNQVPSLIDHIWTNSPDRILSYQNLSRSVSDHNVIIVRVSLKESAYFPHDIVKRVRRDFDITRYQESIGNIDWTGFYELEDVNLTERATQQQLLKHLEDTNQLHGNHHAYRSMLSTTTALLQASDMIYQGTDENAITSTMTIDQSSAFDCVDHDILVNKLSMYNISEDFLKWVRNYLDHRSQYVVVGSAQSRMLPVYSGVPQGSVLGPLLYVVYTNELPEVTRDRSCQDIVHNNTQLLFGPDCSQCGSVPLYADDATYLYTSNSRELNQRILI